MKPKRPDSVFRHLYEQPYHGVNRASLYNSAKGSLSFVQRLGLLRKLPVHYGCVNCICWSDNGQFLLSGSDDQRLVVSDANNFKKVTDYKTSHRANIFSAKFLPSSGDRNIVSCSGDGIILFTDLNRPSCTHNSQFNCHTGTTYDVATVPGEPYTFLSCGEDFTVRCFDLRVKESCNKLDCQEDILISCQRAVTALTVNGVAPHQLAIGCSDSTVRLFDRRNLGTRSSGFSRANCVRPIMSLTAPGLEGKSYRITSLAYSPEGNDILVSYSSEHLYLFNCKNQECTTMKQSIGGDLEEEEDEEEGGDEGGEGGRVGAGGFDKTESASPSLPPIRRLRLRGDWSDTGPDARPEREPGRSGDVAQARPTLHATLMQRMTDVLSRMLNDPATRAALSHGGEEDNPLTGPSEVDQMGRGGEELGMSLMDGEGEERAQEDNTLPSPARSQLSEGEGSDGSNDMVWSSEDVNTSQPTAGGASSSVGALGEETVSLPSFESTYSSYTNLVKSPAPAPCPNMDDTTPPCSSSSVANNPTAAAAAVTSVPVINVDETLSPSSSSLSSASVAVAPPPPSSAFNPLPLPEPVQPIATASSEEDNSSATDQESLSCLTDQLFTMRHGFIEKHGTEPMVNLHYSEKGSTASRITMSVANEVNREPAAASTSASTQNIGGGSTSAAASADQPRPTDDVAGPSRVATAASSSSSSSSPKKPPEPMSEEDDSTLNSDDESELPSVNLSKRLIHPIERHMESAIETARSNSGSTPINPLCEKTKVPKQTPVKMKFTGHRNARTMIKEATFWGSDYVMSGSDCGHVFVWERSGGGRLVMLLEADHHVVNCIQPHPHLPLLATSGIDYDVKLWAPLHHESAFNQEMAEELMKRNEVMLEETKDTITVPASFMIRMLACLNQIRRGGRSRGRRNETSSSD